MKFRISMPRHLMRCFHNLHLWNIPSRRALIGPSVVKRMTRHEIPIAKYAPMMKRLKLTHISFLMNFLAEKKKCWLTFTIQKVNVFLPRHFHYAEYHDCINYWYAATKQLKSIYLRWERMVCNNFAMASENCQVVNAGMNIRFLWKYAEFHELMWYFAKHPKCSENGLLLSEIMKIFSRKKVYGMLKLLYLPAHLQMPLNLLGLWIEIVIIGIAT